MANSTMSSGHDPDNPNKRWAVRPIRRSHEQAEAYYDRISSFYDLLTEWSEGRVRTMALKMLDAHSGETFVDIGFGTGKSLVQLAQATGANGNVFGIDLSGKMVLRAKRRLAKAGLTERVSIVKGNALQMPFPSNIADAIFISFTLELFDTPEIPMVLAECRRVLRDEGRIVVVALTKESSQIRVRLYEWLHDKFPKLADCRPIFVGDTLKDSGFVISKAQTANIGLPVEIVVGINPRS